MLFLFLYVHLGVVSAAHAPRFRNRCYGIALQSGNDAAMSFVVQEPVQFLPGDIMCSLHGLHGYLAKRSRSICVELCLLA